MLVNVPSISATCAEGSRKTSVLMSSGRTSPFSTSGALYQKAAVSVSKLSLTTSQSSFASAARWSRPLSEVAGFWPIANMPRTLPSAMFTIIAMCEWSPAIFGCQP